jgi:hypothetical protein
LHTAKETIDVHRQGLGQIQHYRDRNPPWVKLHKQFLDDYDSHSLPVTSRALAPMLWLLASEHDEPKSGAIEWTEAKIAFRLHMTLSDFMDAMKPLIDKGFIVTGQHAITLLAERLHDATPETENRGRGQRHKKGFSAKGKDHGKQKPTTGSEGVADYIERCRAEALASG